MVPEISHATGLDWPWPDQPCYPMGLIQYYQITCQPVNQAICIFIIVPIVFFNLVSIKSFIILLLHHLHANILFNETIEIFVLKYLLIGRLPNWAFWLLNEIASLVGLFGDL